MTYWDTSALCPLLRSERASDELELLFSQTDDPITSWISTVEVLATQARWRDEGVMSAGELRRAEELWAEVSDRLYLVADPDAVERSARDLLSRRLLRGMDAIHLASWKVVAASETLPLPLVTLDKKLRAAGEAEGATVLPATLP